MPRPRGTVFNPISTASASMVEMTRAGLSLRSKIHGHSVLVISWLCRLDLQG